MSKLFSDLARIAGNEFSSRAEDGLPAGDVDDFIDTGSYSLNALLSGSIFGGMPNNKILALAGEEATGKTFFALGIIKHFLDKNKDAGVFYFESEGALTKEILESRGIDLKRLVIFPVTTIQEFRTQALKVVNAYMELEKQPPFMMVLDSLGNLSTTKEVEDITAGSETRDMTRTQLIRGTFRVLSLKLSKAKVPFIFTNHTYQTMDMFRPKEMSGGGGVRYAASQIVFLSKSKDRDKSTKELLGNVITCLLNKSRLTKEGTKVQTKLSFTTGLNPYYGLVEIAIKHGIMKKLAKQVELPDGTKVTVNKLYNGGDKYFTDDLLNQIDKVCKEEFMYGVDLVVDALDLEHEEESEEVVGEE